MGVVVPFRPKPKKLDPDRMDIGDPVKASPVGAGKFTGITPAGYPQVDDIAVTWLIREDGAKFDPHGHTQKAGFKEEDYYEKR